MEQCYVAKGGGAMKYKAIYEQLKERHEELKARLEEKERFGLEQSTRDMTGELSLYDNHPADIGTELFERGKDLALQEMLEREYHDVNKALKKIEDGTYGICEVTGETIPYERLEANPTATTVIDYAQSHVSKQRPIEEDVLEGFRKYNFDHDERETEFDAEDAYQAVARFNENSMVFEGSSLDDEDELIGSVEQVEGFLSNGIEGYTGIDEVETLRNVHYDQYFDGK